MELYIMDRLKALLRYEFKLTSAIAIEVNAFMFYPNYIIHWNS